MSDFTDQLIDGIERQRERRKPKKGKRCANPYCCNRVSPYIPNEFCYWCERRREARRG